MKKSLDSCTIEKREGTPLYTVLIISVIIVIVVLLLTVLTTSKAYQYKHTVDSIENNPYLQNQDMNENEDKKSE